MKILMVLRFRLIKIIIFYISSILALVWPKLISLKILVPLPNPVLLNFLAKWTSSRNIRKKWMIWSANSVLAFTRHSWVIFACWNFTDFFTTWWHYSFMFSSFTIESTIFFMNRRSIENDVLCIKLRLYLPFGQNVILTF